MSFMQKIFGSAPVAQVPVQAAPQPPTPGNIPANAAVTTAAATGPGTAPNGTIPATTDNTGGTGKSGLDAFTDLFTIDPASQQQGQPLFNVDHEAMLKSARSQDFRGGITKEQLEAVQAGGAEATQALLEVVNAMSQNVYAQSAFATTKLIEGALTKGGYAKASDVDSRIRSTAVTSTLREANPMFTHPAAQPMINGLRDQLMVKFPQATPAEISSMANDYLVSFSQLIQAPAQEAASAKANKAAAGEDWSKYFE